MCSPPCAAPQRPCPVRGPGARFSLHVAPSPPVGTASAVASPPGVSARGPARGCWRWVPPDSRGARAFSCRGRRGDCPVLAGLSSLPACTMLLDPSARHSEPGGVVGTGTTMGGGACPQRGRGSESDAGFSHSLCLHGGKENCAPQHRPTPLLGKLPRASRHPVRTPLPPAPCFPSRCLAPAQPCPPAGHTTAT